MNSRRTFLLILTTLALAGAPPNSPAQAQSEAPAPDLKGRADLMNAIEGALDSGSLEAAESHMADFRSRYPATSRVRGWENGNEVVYLYNATLDLAEAYAERGDFDRTLQVFEDEIDGLTLEVPHYSWRLIAASIPYQLETGAMTRDQIRSRVDQYQSRFSEMGEQVEHPGRKSLFQGLVGRMESAARHLHLIGEPAPGFTFTHAFNAEPSLELDSLHGKVVLIDFWATWCAPCMAAWPGLATLHERWREQGFEILSVTSLQGGVGAEKGLTPEREIELTLKFIERHQVSWPVLFSDRSVNDPEYGATTLPSYVVLDREGRVASVLVGHFGILGEAIIERLLAEVPKS